MSKVQVSSDLILHGQKEIVSKIILIRRQRVIIDADIAELYGVTTKRINEQVKRNIDRFPTDFVFQLDEKEKAEVVANCDRLSKLKFSSTLPYAFTEHGAIMAASVLNSPQAIEMSVFVVRAFIALREFVFLNKDIEKRMRELENKISKHDDVIRSLVSAIRDLMSPPVQKKKKIGF